MTPEASWGWGSSNTQVRFSHARRDYVCDRCKGTIKKGEYYEAVRSAFSYRTSTYHYHYLSSTCKKAGNQ